MKRFLFLLTCLLSFLNIQAQIVGPDSACKNTVVNFSSTDTMGTTYNFVYDTVNINQTPGSSARSRNLIVYSSTPKYTKIVYDRDTNRYVNFTTGDIGNFVTRGLFPVGGSALVAATGGSNLISGLPLKCEGIDIIRDPSTGFYWGLVVDSNQLVKLNFGKAVLTGIPSTSSYTFNTQFSNPHQITIKHLGSQWIAFVGNKTGTITRLDFGTSMGNTPTATVLPNVGSLNGPCNFSLYQQGTNWYMLVNNYTSSTVSRINFGSNLLNNTPTGTNLGSFSGLINAPRGMVILNDCNELYAMVQNEGGTYIRLDFNNDITSVPTATLSATYSYINAQHPVNSLHSLTTVYYSNTLFVHQVNCGDSAVYRIPFLTYPAPTTGNYYTYTSNNTFPTAGNKYITLYEDQGMASGPSVFCKPFISKDSITGYLGNDTTVCAGGTLNLHADSSHAATYIWRSTPITATNGATTASVTVNSTAAYWVNLTGAGCYKSDTINVTFSNLSSFSLGNDTTICLGDSIRLSPHPNTYTNVTYQWDGGTASAIDSVRIIKTSGTHILKVMNAYGCTSADTIKITVNPLPSFTLGNDTAICAGNSLILKPTPTQPITSTYLWKNGSVLSSQTVSTAGSYWLEVTDAYKCKSRDTITITVTPLPIVNLGPDKYICTGDSLLLSSINPTAGHHWSTGATTATIYIKLPLTYILFDTLNKCVASDTMVLKLNPKPIFTLGFDKTICQGDSTLLKSTPSSFPITDSKLWSTGVTGVSQIYVKDSGNYWFKVTTDSGCYSIDTVHVKVNPLPLSNLGVDTFFCTGDSIRLTNNPLFQIGVSQKWYSSTSFPSSLSTGASIWVKTVDTYWIVNTNNFTNCVNRDTVIVHENPKPIFNLGNDTTVCEGISLVIKPSPSLASTDKFKWSTFPNSLPQNGATTDSIIVNRSGFYSLRDTSIYGCTFSDNIRISVRKKPTVNLGADTLICSNQTITMHSTPTHGLVDTTIWNTGAIAPTIAVNSTGLYWLRVDSNGCTAYDSAYVTVNTQPIVNLGNDTILCLTNFLILSSTQPTGYTYLWSTGDTTSSINVTQNGTYILTVSNGICETSDTIKVSFSTYVPFKLGSDTTFCNSSYLTLGGTVTDPNYTYTWFPNALATPSVIVNTSGMYVLQIDNAGCKTRDTIILNALVAPIVNLGNDTFMCAGPDSILYKATNLNTTYLWNTGETSSTKTIKYSGTYWLHATANNGCTAADTVTISVLYPPLAYLGKDTTICREQSIVLPQRKDTSITSYLWQDGSTQDTFYVNTTGNYWLQETNICGTRKDSIKIIVTLCNIHFPNAFTPNADHLNDLFLPVGDLSGITDYEFSVFDRWGEQLFKTNSVFAGWDGWYKGVVMPVGVYVYQVRYKSNGESFVQSGNVSLVH